MYSEQPGRRQQRHLLGDGIPPIAALRHVARVAEALHQHDPSTRDALRIPAGAGRLAGKPVARQGGDHEVERVCCAAAVGGGIGQRIDDFQLLDDRAGPAVRHDQRQRVWMLRAHVNEVDIDAVDVGHELWNGVQLRLALAPVVVRGPIVRELLNGRELARLATRPRPAPFRANAWPRCGVEGRPELDSRSSRGMAGLLPARWSRRFSSPLPTADFGLELMQLASRVRLRTSQMKRQRFVVSWPFPRRKWVDDWVLRGNDSGEAQGS